MLLLSKFQTNICENSKDDLTKIELLEKRISLFNCQHSNCVFDVVHFISMTNNKCF